MTKYWKSAALIAALALGMSASRADALTLASLAPDSSVTLTSAAGTGADFDADFDYVASMQDSFSDNFFTTAFQGNVYSAVYERTTSGAKAFLFQVENTSLTPAGEVSIVIDSTDLNYMGYNTSVGFLSDAPSTPGTLVTPTGQASGFFPDDGSVEVATVERTADGINVTFTFEDGLDPSEFSKIFVIHTNASDWRTFDSTIGGSVDGGNASGTATVLGPRGAVVPEPGTLAMAGIALPLLGLGYLRRRRSQV